MFELKNRYTTNELHKFAEHVIDISSQIGFKVSSRGWCYLLETNRLINKDQFDKVESLINSCRRKGILPIDFVAEEKAREFMGVEVPNNNTIVEDFDQWINAAMNAPEHYNPDWWEGEEYYIQLVVEKIDLVTLFQPVCREYHIPIANSKGWSSMLQRATYARRFKEAEDKGLQCVLLYCGDHDPDGLRISDFIKTNLHDLETIQWNDGEEGYNPENLMIQRFGLNADYIQRYNLTWIDNLITGSGKNLASKSHKNHRMPYVQDYLKKYGARKVEANAIVTQPRAARELVREAIEGLLGEDALDRFEEKTQIVRDEFNEFMKKSKLDKAFENAIKIIKGYNK